jgi:mannosyltransferase
MTRQRLKPRGNPTADSIRAGSHAGPSSVHDVFAAAPPIRAPGVDTQSAVALLILAVVVGGILRFSNLGADEMSADEGASWAAASAQSIYKVLQLQPRLNPGKFAVHDIALHAWIRLFGDGLTALRALSALAGTLGIIAVFFVTRELCGLSQANSPPADEKEDSSTAPSDASAAAFAALLFAVNLIFIKYAHEARMYSIALLCVLTQVVCFLRSLCRPKPVVLLFVALFTALAIASTFTTILIVATEVLWLAYLMRRPHGALRRNVKFAVSALSGGLALLIAPAMIYLHAREHAPPLLAYAWASTPPVWAPFSMFNKATGSVAFPVVLALALWGTVCCWRQQTEAIVFLLLWMLVPPVLVLAGSYLIRPAFVERYLLASFVPFFLLVAFGICNVGRARVQFSVLALAALLALGHDYSYWRHQHDVQWREAVRAATSTTGRMITVAPPYAKDVVRYYLRDSSDSWSVEVGNQSSARVAIVADTGVSPPEAAQIATFYPRLLTHLRGVNVLER